jgi:MraZ protein
LEAMGMAFSPDIIFIGTYWHTMDNMGRIAMPSDYRDELSGQTLFMIKNPESKSIVLYTQEGFKNYLNPVAGNEMQITDEQRRVRYMFAADAVRIQLDKAGRFRLTEQLRDHAGISKDVAILGTIEKLEIWDADVYKKFRDGEDDDKTYEIFKSMQKAQLG